MQMNNMKLNGDPGASGGGTILTTPATPAAPPATPPPGAPPPATPPASTPTWRDTLAPELKDDATLGKYKDIQSLAAAHVALNRHLGAEKLIIPGKNATEDDWKQVYSKLGVPEKVEEYGVKFKEGATLDKDFVKQFTENAHKQGILPKQAQAMADWFADLNGQAEQKLMEQRSARIKEDLGKLKTELGNAFEPQLALAGKFVQEFATPEEIKYLEDTGLGNDIGLVRLFMKAGKDRYGEDIVRGQEKGGGTQLLNPADASKAARSIISDKNNPNYEAYHNAQHPNHKAALAEVQSLFEQASVKK